MLRYILQYRGTVSRYVSQYIVVVSVAEMAILCFFLWVFLSWQSSYPFPLWGRAQGTKEGTDFCLELVSLSLISTIPSGGSFLRWEAVGKNVLLWPAVFEGGIATAAVS